MSYEAPVSYPLHPFPAEYPLPPDQTAYVRDLYYFMEANHPNCVNALLEDLSHIATRDGRSANLKLHDIDASEDGERAYEITIDRRLPIAAVVLVNGINGLIGAQLERIEESDDPYVGHVITRRGTYNSQPVYLQEATFCYVPSLHHIGQFGFSWRYLGHTARYELTSETDS